MISTVWDVTDRKRAEEALQESEERYRQLFEESPVALYEEDFSEVKKAMDSLKEMGVKDLDQYFDEHPEFFVEWVKRIRILRVNQEAKRLFGINIDAEIPPFSEHEALGPVSKVFRHEFAELFSGHTKVESIGQAQDFNGNDIHIAVRLEVLGGHENKLDRILVSVQDVTDQVRAKKEVDRSYERVRKSFLATVRSLAAMSELRDPYTAGHQKRVSQLAGALAEKLNLESETIMGLKVAGLVHDIGKLQVPAEILSRPGNLTDIEFSLIKEHPSVVSRILEGIDLPWPVAEIAHQHHERLDGSGYPRGLRSQEIMMEARILGVADVVEAMSSHRPYRPAHSLSDALDEIKAYRGSRYDPAVVDACIELFEKDKFEFEEE
jgi:putative nucleotidyltransferase with HDIG domain